MTALIESRTENKQIRLLGARISQSQSDEMNFMRHWLEMRGESHSTESPSKSNSGDHEHMPASPAEPSKTQASKRNSHDAGHGERLMPGMLTKVQMDALRDAKGDEFDRLFLKGMIQHHKGALVMVKDLYDTPGAGQDAELFNFATDVDSGQRAEIRRMETMLSQIP